MPHRLDVDARPHDGLNQPPGRRARCSDAAVDRVGVDEMGFSGERSQRVRDRGGLSTADKSVTPGPIGGKSLRRRGAMGGDPAVGKYGEMREAVGNVSCVDRRDDGAAHERCIADEPFGFSAVGGIEAGERIIKHQHLRVVQERPRDQQPLCCAVGELVDLLAAATAEARQRQRLVECPPQPGAREAGGVGKQLEEVGGAGRRPGFQAGRHVADEAADAGRITAH